MYAWLLGQTHFPPNVLESDFMVFEGRPKTADPDVKFLIKNACFCSGKGVPLSGCQFLCVFEVFQKRLLTAKPCRSIYMYFWCLRGFLFVFDIERGRTYVLIRIQIVTLLFPPGSLVT